MSENGENGSMRVPECSEDVPDSGEDEPAEFTSDERASGRARRATEGARKVRPIYTVIPRADGAFDIHKCFGLEEVRKVLAAENIGSDDPRLESVVLIRGDEIPLAVEKQVKFTFGPR